MEVKLLLLIIFLSIVAANANYKKTYCHSKEFIPTTQNKYPHLHCGKRFLTYSNQSNDHVQFMGSHGVDCKKVKKVLESDILYEIRNVLEKFYKDECDSSTEEPSEEPSRKRTPEKSSTHSKKKREGL